MADKAISELVAANQVTPTDLFVLEQSGTAKKLTGMILENWLLELADGHGGIQSIAKASTSGLVDTYRVTFADLTTYDFEVTNGKSITKISKTKTSGLVDTYTITYNDSTTSTFTVTNGAKGDKGDSQYVWIKYASQEPTDSSHSFGDLPDNWIGIYSGDSATAPSNWDAYNWFEIKGDKGDTGAAARLTSSAVEYQVGDSGSVIPSGIWSASIPLVAQGKYLWTRTTNTFNTGAPVVSYSVSRMGLDGSGSVSAVANVSPGEDGNVPLTADHIGALPVSGGTMTGPIHMEGQALDGLSAPMKEDEAATMGYTNTQITDRAVRSGGKNLTDIGTLVSTVSNMTLTKSGETVRLVSTAAGSWHIAKTLPVMLRGGVTYTMSLTVDAYVKGTLSFGFHSSATNSFARRHSNTTQTGRLSVSYTPTEDGEYSFAVMVTTTNSELGDATFSDIMVEVGSVATNFEPYYFGLAELRKKTLQLELAWENASPESAFANQVVTFDKGNCQTFAVEHNGGLTFVRGLGQPTNIVNMDGDRLTFRICQVTADGMSFYSGRVFPWDTGGALQADNTYVIPKRIYRVREEL